MEAATHRRGLQLHRPSDSVASALTQGLPFLALDEGLGAEITEVVIAAELRRAFVDPAASPASRPTDALPRRYIYMGDETPSGLNFFWFGSGMLTGALSLLAILG